MRFKAERNHQLAGHKYVRLQVIKRFYFDTFVQQKRQKLGMHQLEGDNIDPLHVMSQTSEDRPSLCE